MKELPTQPFISLLDNKYEKNMNTLFGGGASISHRISEPKPRDSL